ncbi:MAG: acetate/propionate family kinase [Pseudomonadota bacterium]|nr:acetate/propionate family kinase [Pseudomonadota bacterium]
MPQTVLTVNAGSSSLKFALFDAGAAGPATARGEIADLGASPHLVAHDAAGAVLAEQRWPAGLADPFAIVLEALLAFAETHLGKGGLAAVGHRIVHGGADHIAPARITPALLAALEALTPLDPLHLPHNITPIRAVAAARPALPQVACFDTAFHHTLPPVARWFGLPRALEAAGVRRYGFHGLSYEYIAAQLRKQSPALARGRVIAAHLGSGASLCALQDGRSIATTMGFSTLDGLVMATRCGSLDPGVILYLGRQGHSFAEIEDMLYHRSGLLGVSGISGDIRELLTSEDPRAREAIELFTYRIATEAGALVSTLGGLDGLVFTAGIGEHAPAIRAAICARLAWLGLRLDATANAANGHCISTPDSVIEARVIATDEEAMIAHHTKAVIDGPPP